MGLLTERERHKDCNGCDVQRSFNVSVSVSENKKKQECIPVVCVPPAAVAVRGGVSTRPPGADPPDQAPPWDWAPAPGTRHPSSD